MLYHTLPAYVPVDAVRPPLFTTDGLTPRARRHLPLDSTPGVAQEDASLSRTSEGRDTNQKYDDLSTEQDT